MDTAAFEAAQAEDGEELGHWLLVFCAGEVGWPSSKSRSPIHLLGLHKTPSAGSLSPGKTESLESQELQQVPAHYHPAVERIDVLVGPLEGNSLFTLVKV